MDIQIIAAAKGKMARHIEKTYICDVCGKTKKERDLPEGWCTGYIGLYHVSTSRVQDKFDLCDNCYDGRWPKDNQWSVKNIYKFFKKRTIGGE